MMMWNTMPGMIEPDLILTTQMISPTMPAQIAHTRPPWQSPKTTDDMTAATAAGIALPSLLKM